MKCPVCGKSEVSPYHQDKLRSYCQCFHCKLVFVPRSELISEHQEIKRYEAHENESFDPNYQNYMAKISSMITPHLEPGDKGLDFGCGRSKMLEKLITGKGWPVTSYDKYFHPLNLLGDVFDFIVLSEVIEHLRTPEMDLQDIKRLLASGGKLFIKTKILPPSGFDQWFYKRDITHVQFFSEKSFQQLGLKFQLRGPEYLGNDLWLFRNN
jgi:ubiquinone/menaquinone biosynthesis C-methylase UbiE